MMRTEKKNAEKAQQQQQKSSTQPSMNSGSNQPGVIAEEHISQIADAPTPYQYENVPNQDFPTNNAGGAPVDAIDDKEVGSGDGGENAHGSPLALPLPPAAIPAFDETPASTPITTATPTTPSCPNVVRGCWQLSTGHHDDMAEATEVWDNLNRAVGQGFTAVDCGDIYSGVEELLGGYMMFGRWKGEGEGGGGAEAAVADAGADADADAGADAYDGRAEPNLRVHTKFVPDKRLLPVLYRSSNQRHVRAVVRRSLNRLGLASLPLVQFHWWDYEQVRLHVHSCTSKCQICFEIKKCINISNLFFKCKILRLFVWLDSTATQMNTRTSTTDLFERTVCCTYAPAIPSRART